MTRTRDKRSVSQRYRGPTPVARKNPYLVQLCKTFEVASNSLDSAAAVKCIAGLHEAAYPRITSQIVHSLKSESAPEREARRPISRCCFFLEITIGYSTVVLERRFKSSAEGVQLAASPETLIAQGRCALRCVAAITRRPCKAPDEEVVLSCAAGQPKFIILLLLSFVFLFDRV